MADVTDQASTIVLGPVDLKINLKIKFRAFFITFANVDYSTTISLPAQVSWVEQIVHFEKIAYNDHGVQLTISLV